VFEPFVIFQTDYRWILGRGGQRHDAGEIASTAEKIELDAGEDGEEGEGIEEGK
jgi:hypothetical protein